MLATESRVSISLSPLQTDIEMGESSDKKIQSEIDKYKARGWRICKCGFGWGIVGLILFVIGIIFLAYFGKYWGDKDHWEKYVT